METEPRYEAQKKNIVSLRPVPWTLNHMSACKGVWPMLRREMFTGQSSTLRDRLTSSELCNELEG